MKNPPAPLACQFCNRPIKGRSDKKFCDDFCRNSFNNQRKGPQDQIVRNINNILRKNRSLMAQWIPEAEQTHKIHQDQFTAAGFNVQYHTHQVHTQKGTYFFCYDYGYLTLESKWILVVREKQKSPHP